MSHRVSRLRGAVGCVAFALIACGGAPPAAAPAASAPPRWGLVIHGGAGRIAPELATPEAQAEHRAALAAALIAGHAVLASGGTSTDAVIAVVTRLEDSPLFNAGKGAVFTHDGTHELDAAIMNGGTMTAGAVAGVRRVKNPILLARRVMERSPHVMLVGSGADAFAEHEGLELVDPSYFDTDQRRRALERALEAEQRGPTSQAATADTKFGTVGAVALDQAGVLAAATSTGGMTNKRWGRVGDAPIIGAGTYATSDCAVSATGHGEFFIRHGVAHDICARLRYQRLSIAAAADAVVKGVLVEVGGEGGVIAMDGSGAVAMPFNSASMYRGVIGPDGVPRVAILGEEPAPVP
jgi:L-asparaginase / beta-aspartyl-peptidase